MDAISSYLCDWRGKSRLFSALFILAAIFSAFWPAAASQAAELRVEDGVVVKFAPGARLTVRDRIVVGKGVTLTSQKDDSIGGQTSATPQTAAAGDWQGVRLEKSTQAFGSISLNDSSIRFAGANGEAALTLFGLASSLQHLQISDSSTALRLLGRAAPTISGASFLRNGVGIDADNQSAPTISDSQFVQNSGQAILNRTPTTTITATGNWWGDASGPRDSVGNPQGRGDAVSSGVNYGSFLTAQPLLNPTIRQVAPMNYQDRRTVSLDIACVNAIEYRIAENDAFVGLPFLPFANGRAAVDYLLSAGDGRKSLGVQFRGAGGNVVAASLSGGVMVDMLPPAVSITNPAAGSVITQSIRIEAAATDASGIARVEIYLDGQLLATRNGTPYTFDWDVSTSLDGVHQIKVVATDLADRQSQQSVDITLTRVVLPPDTEGPQLANILFGGAALSNGSTLTRNTNLTLSASDRSGIARIDVLLDGSVVATASGSASYSAPLSLDGIANGVHTLVLRAVDSLGNTTSNSYSITVAHAVPDAPTLSQPQNGQTTRTAAQSVAGTAPAGSSVQLLLNGQAAGTPLTAGSDGRFSGTVTLVSGTNLIQATASNSYGTSTASAAIQVNLDSTVPASPSALTAAAQAAGKVRLTWNRSSDPNTTGYDIYRAPSTFNAIGEAVKLNSSPLNVSTFDDLPPQDGSWTYRIVAVNAAGTPSVPTNAAQAISDATAPKALSIVYTSLGKVDGATGRMGQGRVNLVLTTSEILQTVPYLSIVPQGGLPIPVELLKTGDTTYSGNFLIDVNTASGVANALFSARDQVGNRGTDVAVGATLKIDTEGPQLSNIVLSPVSPIKNDTAQTLQVTFTYSKAPSSTPQIKYLLSGPVRSAVAINLTPVNATTYQGSFMLPSDAGLGSPEILSFSQQAKDDLDNISTKVSAFNRYQIYQGNLPPLDIPFGFTAKAQAGGKVKLSWQAVTDVTSYQIYRQAPGEATLQALARTGGIEYIDQTPQDGTYKYAIASVRQANGQESLSSQTSPVDVVASATAPGAPQNLTLNLNGQGIYAVWQPPLASAVDYYNLYRAAGTSISNIDGLTPLKTRIKTPQTYDTNPSPTQGAYVVTAVDAAGNESAISNSAYLNASLLPVRDLKVEQLGNNLPIISWAAPNGNVAGYLVYVGPDSSKTKLTASRISTTSLTDTGYTSGERRYTVASVDANGVEMPRSVILPNISSQIVAGLPIKRGIMNKLQVQVSNTSSANLDGVRVVVRLPINKEATQFKDHKSEPITLTANQTRLVPVIVGGYADLPGAPQAQVGVEIAPNEGELVKVSNNQTVAVTEGSLVVGMATDEFTRGAAGKLKLTIENTSDVDIELLTATNNGAGDSSELRFRILDADGNVLASQPYKQIFGANVVTLTNGLTVARIPAGANYVSDTFNLNVPSASPNSIRVKLEVDKLRYHSGQDDEVLIAGRGSEKTVSLIDTAYIGEVTDVNPISSFGDQDIVISGRALDRISKAPLPNSRLKLVLNQQGFERTFSVLTDGGGNFIYPFKPTLTDAGLYKVSAVHPDITDRPEQKAFTINRVTVGPTPYKLDIPKNYPFSIPFTAKAGPGTAATNLRLVLDAASQPTGQLPAGVNLQLPNPVSLVERQTLNIPVIFSANNDAQPSGAVILNVISDEHAATPLGQVRIDYTLSEAKPYLTSTPSFVETGLAQGGSQIESVVVKNNGLQDAMNLQFTLTKADGTSVPSWASIASQANGTLAIGQSRSIDLSFTPPSGTPEGIYEFKLKVVGDNFPSQALNVYVSLTQSGQGNVLFKAADIYTATVGKDGKLIAGLANASITLQNEDVATVTRELLTDSMGEALFQSIPAGRYKFRAKAANHQEVGGRLIIKPGITLNQALFLDYNLITVEWSVREITIQDRYEITLNATFETDVPAAVLVIQPTSINLPKMAVGDVYYGELNLTNYGLIRADNVQQQLPQSDGMFRYEFLVEVPNALQAKQRVTIPYRVVALQSLEDASSAANSSGGGCYNYSARYGVGCSYDCANGTTSSCGASTTWFAVSNSSCPGGGGSGSSSSWIGSGWGGGGGSFDTLSGMPPCVKCNGQCCIPGAGGNPQ